jgi:hypothetical protein
MKWTTLNIGINKRYILKYKIQDMTQILKEILSDG